MVACILVKRGVPKILGIEIVPSDPPVKWQLTMTRPGGGNLQDMEVKDVLLVFGYEWADS